MEQNLPIVAKKFWHIVRVLYFMVRKGISKGKLIADLSMLMKRGKIASKSAIHNLMFHHISTVAKSHESHVSYPVPPEEYEFSCNNSPSHYKGHTSKNNIHNFFLHLPSAFNLMNKKNRNSTHGQLPPAIDPEMVAAALEVFASATSSPALPGFGRTPMVRQLRITDSPYPLNDVEEDSHVDEAAEEFIMKFYKDLKSQSSPSPLGRYYR